MPGRGVTIYAWLLRLYPAEFRDAFGADMRSLFAARHADAQAQGRAAVARAWAGVILDTLRTAAAEHVDIVRRDARQAWRGLVRDRTYLVFGAGVLAAGFAVAVTIVGVVQAVLLAPLPYPDPERLVRIEQTDPRGGTWGFAEPTFLDLAERSTTLQDVAALREVRGTLSVDGMAETIDGARVSASWFTLLGVRPSFGRVFSAAANRPGGPCEVLATPALAARRFGGAPRAVGRTLEFDGRPCTITGIVAPPRGLLDGATLYLPLAANAVGSRTARELDVLARRRPGADAGTVRAELDALAARAGRETPASDGGWRMRPGGVREWLVGPFVPRMLWLLLGAVLLLWALACANVAALALARHTTRLPGIALRTALGASRSRLVRALATEGAIVAAIGAAAGVVLAVTALAALRRGGADLLPQLAQAGPDPATLGTAAVLAALAAVGVGILPTSRPANASLAGRLAHAGRATGPRSRLRGVLVAVQVAAAVVLLVGAGLLLRSVVALASVNPGYDAGRVLAVHLSMPEARYDATRRAEFLREADQRLRRLPSVTGAGATNVAPFGHMSTANRFRLERSATGDGYLVAAWRSVTPGFFRALGIPRVRGRLFDDRDGADGEQVVIVSRSMAERFWPDIDPIGQRLLWGSSRHPKRIVGIVEDLRDISLSEDPRPTMFRPYSQLTPPDMTLLVRTSGSPGDIAATVRAELRALDPGVPVRVEPLAEALRGSVRYPRVGAAALAAFATLALGLAAAGLYALVAYDVSRQRRETAVRIALGAPPVRVLWTVQRRTLGMVAAGGVAGVAGALAASRALESVLFGVHAEDASTYIAVLVVLGVAALTASTLSGRRALSVDPIEWLRSE